MKVGFIINDLDSMDLKKDTSAYLMKEAFNRGHEVRIFDVCNVTYKNDDLYADSSKVHFDNPNDLKFTLENREDVKIKDFSYVINRVNPPFNKEYLYLTQLLEVSGVDCINSAKSLRENNEKLIILNFPELIPYTKVTNSLEEIKTIFNQGFKKVVLKPLDGMGGKSIFFINEDDKNLNVIWETITQGGRKHIIAQEFVDAAADGDNRLTFINYELLPKKLIRLASDNDFRGNLAVGATSKVEDVTDLDRKIASKITPYLKENKIYFAGADMLGDKLSEINLTSPTCLQEIHRGSEINPAEIFWNNLIEG
jgi:glutathione synthase|tara:strand:+ start:639 stop:1568 length:930 start_codon:yes stop_codon:yes gene_type:complete